MDYSVLISKPTKKKIRKQANQKTTRADYL